MNLNKNSHNRFKRLGLFLYVYLSFSSSVLKDVKQNKQRVITLFINRKNQRILSNY